MKTKITCPCCGQEYDVDKSIIGQVVKCEECGTTFTATTVEKNHPSLKVRKPKKVVVSVVIGGVCLLALLLVGNLMFPRVKSNIDYKKGLEAQKEHRYDAAFELFKKAANYGHPEAQFELGCCYGGAEGTVSDIPEAIKWFRKAAEQGHMEAQYRLGLFYQTGLGMSKSETEARFWFEKAAEQGHNDAPYHCGTCIFNPADYSFDELNNEKELEFEKILAIDALPWYKIASEQGFNIDLACYDIGLFYEYGIGGVDKDYNEAIKWFQKAGLKGKTELEICNKWLEAQNGDPEKQYELATMYYGARHFEEAIEWYRKAAEQGLYNAQLFLAYPIRGGKVSETEADKWKQIIRDKEKEQQRKEEELKRLEAERKAAEEAERRAERRKKELSDDDSDEFTYMQEISSGTDPNDPLSHPKYVTQLVSTVSKQSFSGLIFTGVDGKGKQYYDTTYIGDRDFINSFDSNKNKLKVSFQVMNNKSKSLKALTIGESFKHNNLEFTLIDIDLRAIIIDSNNVPFSYSNDLELVAYVQRRGKKEQILCQIGEPVLDPVLRISFRNDLNGNEFASSIGGTFKLGNAKTGEEQYRVISANMETSEVVVESTKNKSKYTIQGFQTIKKKNDYYEQLNAFIRPQWNAVSPSSVELGGKVSTWPVVDLTIAKNGTVSKAVIVSMSGNKAVDDAVDALLAKLKVVPAPPQAGVIRVTLDIR